MSSSGGTDSDCTMGSIGRQCAMVVAALLMQLLSIITKANRRKVQAANPFPKVSFSS